MCPRGFITNSLNTGSRHLVADARGRTPRPIRNGPSYRNIIILTEQCAVGTGYLDLHLPDVYIELGLQSTFQVQGGYHTLQTELSRIQDFAAKQATRDEIKVNIKDYLWADSTGLPESFYQNEIEEKADAVFAHLLISARNESRIQSLESQAR